MEHKRNEAEKQKMFSWRSSTKFPLHEGLRNTWRQIAQSKFWLARRKEDVSRVSVRILYDEHSDTRVPHNKDVQYTNM